MTDTTLGEPSTSTTYPQHTRPVATLFLVAAIAGASTVAVARLWPSLLSTRIGIAHAISFPRLLSVGLTSTACVLAVSRHLLRQRPSNPPTTMWAAAISMCLVAAGLWHLSIPKGQRPLYPPTAADTTITVITWNTQASMTADDLHTLVSGYSPDVLVLPETTSTQIHHALSHDKKTGETHDYQVFASPFRGPVATTSVMVHNRLGQYSLTDSPTTLLGAVTLTPKTDRALPIIVGLHTVPPKMGLFAAWPDDLTTAVALSACAEPTAPTRPRITAGDFNATLAHHPLSTLTHCTDAQTVSGQRYTATWPSDWPSWAGAVIDHIIVTNDITPLTTRVVDVGTSDHRAVVAVLQLPPSTGDGRAD